MKGTQIAPRPRLLFADLDGTLIVEPMGIGPRLRDLIAAIARGEGAFIPTSARPVPHLATMFGAYGLGSFVIGSGGAVVAHLAAGGSFEVTHEEVLHPGQGAEYMARLWRWQEEGRGIVFFFRDHHADFEVAVGAGSCRLRADDLSKIVGRRPMRSVTAPLLSGGLLGVSLLAPSSLEQLHQFCSASLLPDSWRASVYPEYRLSGWSWLEVFSTRANKAEACRRVIDLWRERTGGEVATMAVGDAADDVGMFEAVDLSFCPSDASAEAREAASEVLPAAAGEEFAVAVLAKVESGILPA